MTASVAPPVRAVVFDIGNVLVGWSPANLYNDLIEDPAERAWFLDNVVTLAWHTEHDRGLPLDEGVARLSAQYPEHADLIAAFRDRWEDTIMGAIAGTVALLEALAARQVPLFAITNYSAETFPAFRRRFAFSQHFRDVVVSGEEGLVKPDPAIFALALRRFALPAKSLLFIDDRVDNIEAATAAGMQALHFRNPSDGPVDLAQRLVEVGILSQAEAEQALAQ